MCCTITHSVCTYITMSVMLNNWCLARLTPIIQLNSDYKTDLSKKAPIYDRSVKLPAISRYLETLGHT